MLDFCGTFFSLFATYYLIQCKRIAWLLSLIATTLNGYLFFKSGIYAQMVLEGIYFLSACYGWLYWSETQNSTDTAYTIKDLTFHHGLVLSVLGCLLCFILYKFISIHTDSSIAMLDATTAVLSLIGQWLMCRKIISTWIIWFVVDAMLALIYIQKGLPFHTLLMLVYLSMAVAGYLRWAKLKHSPNPVLA